MRDAPGLDTLASFRERAAGATVVPVVRTMPADWWTPVAAFHRLAREERNAFLLESVERGERVGRFSFLGRRPYLVAVVKEGRLHLTGEDAGRHPDLSGPPLDALRRLLAAYRTPPHPGLPPFLAGAVGAFGYDSVRWVERLPSSESPPAPEPDAVLLFLRDVAAFDHVHRRLYLAANVRVHPGEDPRDAHARGVEALEGMEEELFAPLAPPRPAAPVRERREPSANVDPETFREGVRRAQERIAAGDVFQVVLSRRLTLPGNPGDLPLYRALRAINPSPYMFLLRLTGWSAVGSSPEPLLKVNGDRMSYHPIAGTVPRSGDEEEDGKRAAALSADPKERAEHVMLVDLGRNDLGRVAVPGSVEVDELMAVERYSHVMHLVSGLSGVLRPGLTPLDALYACFPAGTVSGAPKVKAMEIIDEIEPDRRGMYAGAVGYLDFTGNLDTCIALRTMIVRPGEVCVQAGAGIVADSDPEREFQETRHKAEALLEAVDLAWSLREERR